MIVVKLQGGLGNQMFQYAFAKNLAMQNKTTLNFDLSFLLDKSPRENFVFRDFDLDIFNLNVFAEEIKKQSVFKKIKSRLTNSKVFNLKEKHFYFEESNFLKGKNSYIDGYWQSEKYFKEIEYQLRKDFSFKHLLTTREELMNEKIKSTNSVCVNFRRTDFVDLKNSAETHGAVGLDYYYEAIRVIETKISNPVFYVFSDDIDWCEKNFKIDHPTIFVSHKYKGPKFSSYLNLMSNCKHFIIPNSTFAWWGAWLSVFEEKIVIAPTNWFKESSLQDQTQDLLPNNWIKL